MTLLPVPAMVSWPAEVQGMSCEFGFTYDIILLAWLALTLIPSVVCSICEFTIII